MDKILASQTWRTQGDVEIRQRDVNVILALFYKRWFNISKQISKKQRFLNVDSMLKYE